MLNATELTLTTKAVVDHGVARLYVGPLTEVVLWRDTRSNRMLHAQPGEYIMQDSDGYPRRYSAADFAILFQAAPIPAGVTTPGHTATATSLVLTWVDNATDAVHVYQNSVLVATVAHGVQTATLAGLVADTIYTVVLNTVNAYGQESATVPVPSAITLPLAPSTPVLQVLAATAINVKWTNTDPLASIEVLRKAGAGSFAKVGLTLGAGTTELNDTGLTTATLYTYELDSIGSVGGATSVFSATAAATTS